MGELKSQTPAGVRVLAWLTFAKALVAVLVFFSLFFFLPFGLLSLFLLLQGGIYVVVGRGLLHLKRWAYYVTLLMTLLNFVPLNILFLYGGFNIDTLENIVDARVLLENWPFVFFFGLASWAFGVGMIITIFGFHVLLLAYLLQPRIRKVFGITRFLR